MYKSARLESTPKGVPNENQSSLGNIQSAGSYLPSS
jgi:hypothetical protein